MASQKNHKQLLNGCYRTEIKVTPANWNTKKVATKNWQEVEWVIWYRFYDPSLPPKPPIRIRGMNHLNNLEDRQKQTKELLDIEHNLIDTLGYNPHTKSYMVIPPNEEDEKGFIEPDTPFLLAFEKALESKKMDPESKKDIKNKIPHIQLAASKIKINSNLTLESLDIGKVRRKHIRRLLDKIGEAKGEKWTANSFNRYRTDMKIVFNELNELEAMDVNPIDGIARRKTIKQERETLTKKQRKEVNNLLYNKYYTFWRLLHIFFDAGCRETEIVAVEREHVDIEKQQFKVLIKKDGDYRWEWKAISNQVLVLWKELIAECDEIKDKGGVNEKLFVFSVGLKPMWRDRAIRADQITHRWYRLVKKNKDINVTADFYSLKHLSLTEGIDKIVEQAIKHAEEQAAKKAGHRSTSMVKKVYDINSKRRNLKLMKKTNRKFA